MTDLNLLAILVCALLIIVIASLWYSPLLFGNIWIKLAKASSDKSPVKAYLVELVSALVMASVLAYLINLTGAESAEAGAKLAFLIWIGFVVPVLLSPVLWAGKPFKLFLINAGAMLVTLTVIGATLAIWQ